MRKILKIYLLNRIFPYETFKSPPPFINHLEIATMDLSYTTDHMHRVKILVDVIYFNLKFYSLKMNAALERKLRPIYDCID